MRRDGVGGDRGGDPPSHTYINGNFIIQDRQLDHVRIGRLILAIVKKKCERNRCIVTMTIPRHRRGEYLCNHMTRRAAL